MVQSTTVCSLSRESLPYCLDTPNKQHGSYHPHGENAGGTPIYEENT